MGRTAFREPCPSEQLESHFEEPPPPLRGSGTSSPELHASLPLFSFLN